MVDIKPIVLTVRGVDVHLTPDEARELKAILEELYPEAGGFPGPPPMTYSWKWPWEFFEVAWSHRSSALRITARLSSQSLREVLDELLGVPAR